MFYQQLASALRSGTPAPVAAVEALRVLEIVEAARLSNERRAVVRA
jgi:hypothetical protein